MADNLTEAILNQNDLETVRDGAPAYLLMIDSMIGGDPKNTRLLLSGAKLYASYTTVFIADEERAKRLSNTSLEYAKAALCWIWKRFVRRLTPNRPILKLLYRRFQNWMCLYFTGSPVHGLAGYREMPRTGMRSPIYPNSRLCLNAASALNEAYDNGGGHLYLAVLATQLPPSLGGKPEKGRMHF